MNLLETHFLGFIDDTLQRSPSKDINNSAGHAVCRFPQSLSNSSVIDVQLPFYVAITLGLGAQSTENGDIPVANWLDAVPTNDDLPEQMHGGGRFADLEGCYLNNGLKPPYGMSSKGRGRSKVRLRELLGA